LEKGICEYCNIEGKTIGLVDEHWGVAKTAPRGDVQNHPTNHVREFQESEMEDG
jgi:hypothetical protein